MKINHSIEKLNKLQDSINTCSKKANEQLQTEIEIRDEIVNKIRKQYQRSYQQIEKQLELEENNFNFFKRTYEEIENVMDAQLKEKFEREEMSAIKTRYIEEYQQALLKYYDLKNKKEQLYYQKTIASYSKRIKQAQRAFECDKNLKVIEECRRALQISDEDSYIENHEDIKKAQAILKNRIEQIEIELKQSLQLNNNDKLPGLTIGKMFVSNEYLKEWYYQDLLLKVLNGEYEQNCLKMVFNDELNDYVIVATSKQGQAMMRLLEFSTMLDSVQEAIHIYYDYQTLPTLFTVPGYHNCQAITINDDFVLQLQKEINEYPNQMISIFIENGHDLIPAFKQFMVNKPDNVQIVVCQPNSKDTMLYENFIRLKYYQPNNGLECFVINGKYDLYLNRINEKGINRLQNSQPVPIVKINNFEQFYQDNLNQNKYLINSDYSLSFDDNLIIVSKDETKRTLYLVQLLLSRLKKQETKYVYYEDYNDTLLRKVIDHNNFEEIMTDMIESMMDEFLKDDSLVVLVDPAQEVLGFIETLLDMGHSIITSDKVIDGYKNLLLDDNVIEENGKKDHVEYAFLSSESLTKMIEK
ncbi:hypothetical protein [Thomasclavelia spiroformis]|uniref:hypothetical protein n=1 Tax=Thomasclavelia spiroformis TaxID=29348 RepID=UPI0032079390